VAQHGTPEEQRRVRAAVKRRYPGIDVGDDEKDDKGEDLEKGEHGGEHGKTPKESRQWDHVYEAQRARGLSKEASAASAWSVVQRGRKACGPMVKAVTMAEIMELAEQMGMFGGAKPPEKTPAEKRSALREFMGGGPVHVKSHVARTKGGQLVQVKEHTRAAKPKHQPIEGTSAAHDVARAFQGQLDPESHRVEVDWKSGDYGAVKVHRKVGDKWGHLGTFAVTPSGVSYPQDPQGRGPNALLNVSPKEHPVIGPLLRTANAAHEEKSHAGRMKHKEKLDKLVEEGKPITYGMETRAREHADKIQAAVDAAKSSGLETSKYEKEIKSLREVGGGDTGTKASQAPAEASQAAARQEMGHTADDEAQAKKHWERAVDLEEEDVRAAHGAAWQGKVRSRAAIRDDLAAARAGFNATPKTAQDVAVHGHEKALEYHRQRQARAAGKTKRDPQGLLEGLARAPTTEKRPESQERKYYVAKHHIKAHGELHAHPDATPEQKREGDAHLAKIKDWVTEGGRAAAAWEKAGRESTEETAYQIGRRTHASGGSSAPARSSEYMAHHAKHTSGKIGDPASEKLMSEFARGWHESAQEASTKELAETGAFEDAPSVQAYRAKEKAAEKPVEKPAVEKKPSKASLLEGWTTTLSGSGHDIHTHPSGMVKILDRGKSHPGRYTVIHTSKSPYGNIEASAHPKLSEAVAQAEREHEQAQKKLRGSEVAPLPTGPDADREFARGAVAKMVGGRQAPPRAEDAWLEGHKAAKSGKEYDDPGQQKWGREGKFWQAGYYHHAMTKGIRLVRLSKAAQQGIVHLDDAFFDPGVLTTLSPPEVVPGTVMENERGEIIRGVFRIGPYQCEYRRLDGKLPFVTLSSPQMHLPYSMIVGSWSDAQSKALKACDAFARGVAAPDEGVFHRIDAVLKPKGAKGE
jgi:hypothetical protein